MKLSGVYFYGHEISEYGKENGYLDYGTLAKAFDAVLNNDIMEITESNNIGYWEQESGTVDNSEDIEELQEKLEALEELDNEENEDEIQEIEDRISELEEEQDNTPEVFQWFIVDDSGARILKEINEIVYYNDKLDMYLWGVTHYGTSWDYVLTNVRCNCGND